MTLIGIKHRLINHPRFIDCNLIDKAWINPCLSSFIIYFPFIHWNPSCFDIMATSMIKEMSRFIPKAYPHAELKVFTYKGLVRFSTNFLSR